MLATATYAALLKESRTQYINATVLNRKSGEWNGHTADCVGLAPMLMPQTPTTPQKGVRFIAAGVSPRVLELFKLTNVDAVIPMIATVEEAS